MDLVDDKEVKIRAPPKNEIAWCCVAKYGDLLKGTSSTVDKKPTFWCKREERGRCSIKDE